MRSVSISFLVFHFLGSLLTCKQYVKSVIMLLLRNTLEERTIKIPSYHVFEPRFSITKTNSVEEQEEIIYQKI